jgi:cellulose synthase/poly-beta-1,6-N-acetylglucosamine synthase-like glycosyltransferase
MMHLLYIVCGAVLLAFTLPLVLELALTTAANLLPARKWPRTSSAGSTAHKVPLAVIVPAHNEELLVSRCVLSLRASGGEGIHIYVVAHNCSDATAARAASAGAVVLELNDPATAGKGFALRYGFEHALAAGADAVMVIDADSTVSPNTVPAVEAALAQGTRIAQCRYEMISTTQNSGTRLAALAFRGFNVIRPRGRMRLGLSAGILGNGFAISRQVLEAIPYEAFSVVEDLEYHLHLVIAGEQVRYIDEALISAEFPESRAGETVQRSRWEGGRLRTARVWALPLLNRILQGRWRLLEPFCDLTGLPMAYGVCLLLLAAFLPLAWIRWYSAVSLSIVLAHVLTAAWAGGDFLGSLRLLATTPAYIVRKLWLIPGVARGARAKAAWIRTERNNTL